ncbi:MAG TPA: hypothetical protein VGA07_11415 [Anaerolineales bacterium]
MPKTKVKARRALFILVLASLLVVPMAAGFLSPYASAYAQIEFTPSVAPLEVPVLPEPATIGPLIWAPGMQFDCPAGMPERCRPDIVAIHGDDLFGWGEMLGETGLVLVWITDETGTHFLVVSADDPQLTGLPGGDSFMELMEDQFERVEYQGEHIAGGFGSGAVLGGAIFVALALCPLTSGVGCLIGAIGAGAAGLGNVIRNVILMAQMQNRLEQIRLALIGRFHQMELIITGP